MKKLILVLTVFCVHFSVFAFSDFEFKSNITIGQTPFQESYSSSEKGLLKTYGKFYLLGDAAISNRFFTAGGKIYYRIGSSSDASSFTQRMEIKRAFLRFRPFANKLFEISGGKLYSYYLTGNFFNIAEIYTGNSRWGESGVGLKSEINGFIFGLSLPVGKSSSTVETSTKFSDFFALNSSVSYDFSNLSEKIPLTLGSVLGFVNSADDGFYPVASFSANYRMHSDLKSFFSKGNFTLTYSLNAKPFVSNSGFKSVSNYNAEELQKADFFSLNARFYLWKIQFIFEGEAGKSCEKSMIPLYFASQVLIPIVNHFYLKPRFLYYAALDYENSENSFTTYEFYPRVWLNFGKWYFSLGYDLKNKQISNDEWVWEWSFPLYAEVKIGK